MKLKFIYNKFLLIFLLLSIIVSSCSESTQTSSEYGKKVVKAAEKFTYGCPQFFYPKNEISPLYFPENWTELKNLRGVASWTPTVVKVNNEVITKDEYIQRLNLATEINQQTYSQYKVEPGAGFPGFTYELSNTEYLFPTLDFQNGYVCYAFVYRVNIDAGKSEAIPEDCDNIVANKTPALESEYSNEYQFNGDIVAYDWNNDGIFDHVGIIKDNSDPDVKNWRVLSSNGILEHFHYGVHEHRLEVFGTPPRGNFSTWDPGLQDYTWKIFINEN
ncbi:MAG: hypothetical protein L3J41_07565 [Melioribacteraceae bacterium]|nr:hypothetical protein [Melioribacteraceae bacterium]